MRPTHAEHRPVITHDSNAPSRRLLTAVDQQRFIPVLRAPSEDFVVAVATCLIDAGVKIVELTTTTPGAFHAMTVIRAQAADDVLIGMGTVTTAEQVDAAADAGADFVVSPFTTPELVSFAGRRSVAAIVAGWTPTEVNRAWDAGPALVKVFPVGTYGLEHVAALHEVLPDVPLICTGSVTTETAADYIRAGATAVGMSGSLLRRPLQNGECLDELADSVRRILIDLGEAALPG